MPKIQLTIKTTYLSSWQAYEGIREVLQNGRDAEVDGFPLTVDWYNDTLRIENTGATLPVKALLLGHTTKEGRADQIGKFGEGLKLGVLALVRAGHPVKIRSGAEVWIPTLERSETFDEDVLTFRIEGGREDKCRVRIEIGGVSKEAWTHMRACFLFIQKPKKDEATDTYYGTLLTGADYRGRIYVKGIFVQTDPDLRFGYDLRDADLDRDRKMVESWSLRYRTKDILLAALNQRPSLHDEFNELLHTPTTEVESLDSTNSAYGLNDNAAKIVADTFRKQYGEDAVPVATLAESREIEHLGKRGVVVTKQLGAVLARTLGDALTVKENLKKEVVRTYSWSDLDDVERDALTVAIDMVNPVEPILISDIDIVDFRTGLLGQFKDSRVLIAKSCLNDSNETLRVLIHELAHRQGDDGEKKHVHRIEDIWKGVVATLRNRA